MWSFVVLLSHVKIVQASNGGIAHHYSWNFSYSWSMFGWGVIRGMEGKRMIPLSGRVYESMKGRHKWGKAIKAFSLKLSLFALTNYTFIYLFRVNTVCTDDVKNSYSVIQSQLTCMVKLLIFTIITLKVDHEFWRVDCVKKFILTLHIN